MDRANRVFRRSGIFLTSVKSGHSSLRLIISDWKDSKSAYKSYIANQETAWSDMVKWAANEHNRGLREVLDHIMQLQAIWTDIQTQFLSALKKYQHQFETILESELQLDKSRSALNSFEVKEAKLNKELRKASTKSSVEDMKQIEEKMADVKLAIQNAQMEVASKTTENESVKLLLMKEGLMNLSGQYAELGEKTAAIFKAQRIVAATLPDPHPSVERIKYNGTETCSAAVAQVKEYLRNSSAIDTVPVAPPPPYFPPTADLTASLGATYFQNPPRYSNLPDPAGFSQPGPSPVHHQTDQTSPYYTNTVGIVGASSTGPSSPHYYDCPPETDAGNLPAQTNYGLAGEYRCM